MKLNGVVSDELSRREETALHDACMKNVNSGQARTSYGAEGHGVFLLLPFRCSMRSIMLVSNVSAEQKNWEFISRP